MAMRRYCQDCRRFHTTTGMPPPDPPNLTGALPEDVAAAVEAGYQLSTWVAAIQWNGEGNTQAWLDGLCDRIGQMQRLYKRLRAEEKS